MIVTELRLPELGAVAVTRAMLGAGIGLLLAHRLSNQQRKTIGSTLLAIGALTTIPLVMIVFGRRRQVQR